MAFLPSIRSPNPLSAFKGMFDEFFNEPFFLGSALSERMWPKVDISEEKERFIVRADLPGINKDDINVSIDGDTLTIKGEKKEEYKRDEGGYSHIERTSGSFSRSFTLPEYVNKESISATYKNGVLELWLTKVGEARKKAKQIEIKG